MKQKLKVYCFDIDGTICQNTFGEYEQAIPIKERIDFINSLYNKGHEIIMFTARGSTTRIDWYEFTEKQLNSWGLKFNKLLIGKPFADTFIDDKAIEADTYFENILKNENQKENNYFLNVSNNFNLLHKDPLIYKNINKAAFEVADCFKKGGKLFLAGNGGSFADAQHIAAEFTCRLVNDRVPLPAIVLGANSSSVSAIGNDYSFEKIFVREYESLVSPKDILIAITTSGESQNIYELLKYAKNKNYLNWCLTSSRDSRCFKLSRTICTPEKIKATASIQEMHIAIGHLICMLTESYYFK